MPYRALAGYFVGLEARMRYALFLQRKGEPAEARHYFEEVIKASKTAGIVLTDDDKDWVRVARKNVQ